MPYSENCSPIGRMPTAFSANDCGSVPKNTVSLPFVMRPSSEPKFVYAPSTANQRLNL